MFSEYLYFISNPKEEISTKENNFSFLKIIGKYLLFCLCVGALYGLLIFVLQRLDADFARLKNSANHIFDENTGVHLLKILFLAPIIEEFGYRLALKPNRFFLSISFSIQLVYIFLLLKLVNIGILGNLLLMLGLSPLVFFVINNKLINFIKKYYKWFVYYNILLFAILHTTNFDYVSFTDYLYIPILILSILIIGSYLSYIRIKHGIFISIFLHFILNFFINTSLLIEFFTKAF